MTSCCTCTVSRTAPENSRARSSSSSDTACTSQHLTAPTHISQLCQLMVKDAAASFTPTWPSRFCKIRSSIKDTSLHYQKHREESDAYQGPLAPISVKHGLMWCCRLICRKSSSAGFAAKLTGQERCTQLWTPTFNPDCPTPGINQAPGPGAHAVF